MSNQKSILVVGPTMLDIQVFLKNISQKDISVDFSIGGKGYNVAQGVKLFNLPVVLSTMYGPDDIGLYIEKMLSETGITLLNSNRVSKHGGLFVGIHDHHGDTILDKADNGLFSEQTLDGINFATISTILVLSSTNESVMKQLIQAKKDFPEINLCLEIAGRKSIEFVKVFLSEFDFIIANKIETMNMLQITESDNLGSCMDTFSSLKSCKLITTIDKDGVIISDKGASTTIPIHNLPTPIISTVGAGDSVTASIISLHYGYNKPLIESVQQAMIVAGYTIRSKEPFLTKLPISI